MNQQNPEVTRLARRPYPMRVYEDPDSGDWVAEVTDLPGCLGVGETPEEAVKVAKSFVRDWIEEALAQGWDVPQPSTRSQASGRFVVRLPRSLHARLQELSELEGTSLNQLVVSLLSERTAFQQVTMNFEKLLATWKPAAGWFAAWHAVHAAKPGAAVIWRGAYSASLEYTHAPTLVAETPGFYGWAQETQRIPDDRVPRRKATGKT